MKMNRKSFLAKVTGGIAALAVGTKVVAEERVPSDITRKMAKLMREAESILDGNPATTSGRALAAMHQRSMNYQRSAILDDLNLGEFDVRCEEQRAKDEVFISGAQWEETGPFTENRPRYEINRIKPKLIDSDAIKAWRKAAS